MTGRNLMIAPFLAAILLTGLAIVQFCCVQSPVAGGGTEGGNVNGRIVSSDGTGAVHVRVQLVPADHNPVAHPSIPDSLSDTTDSAGNYAIDRVPQGIYTISATSLSDGSGAFLFGVRVDTGNVEAPVRSLRKPGTIRIVLADRRVDTVNGYVFIPGTHLFSSIRSIDAVFIDSVPADTIPSVIYSVRTGTITPLSIHDNTIVIAGDTTTIRYSEGKYSRIITLNTTASGADISTNVYRFPVLVRLNAGTFSFGQAKRYGEDVYFTKSDGSGLPHEIESWDSASGSAAIWVLIDTIHGGNGSQFIRMFWGNPDAVDGSNGGSIFDSNHGFKAVWHLGKNCNDATSGGHHGTAYGAIDAAGIIGSAKEFNGGDSIIIDGLLDSLPSLTLSAWAWTDTSTRNGEEIISVGDAVLIRTDHLGLGGSLGSFHNDSIQPGDTAHYEIGYGPITATTGWRYYTFTFDDIGNVQSFFVDGAVYGTGNYTVPINYTGVGGNTVIGAHGNGKIKYDFYGGIDEVRVCKVARSADWIKLCYMNQKADDALVIFK